MPNVIIGDSRWRSRIKKHKRSTGDKESATPHSVDTYSEPRQKIWIAERRRVEVIDNCSRKKGNSI